MKLLPSRFTRIDFDADDLKKATIRNDYTSAYIQNKIAVLADMSVEYQYPVERLRSPEAVFEAVLEHEKLKAQIVVLEELLQELLPSDASDNSTD